MGEQAGDCLAKTIHKAKASETYLLDTRGSSDVVCVAGKMKPIYQQAKKGA